MNNRKHFKKCLLWVNNVLGGLCQVWQGELEFRWTGLRASLLLLVVSPMISSVSPAVWSEGRSLQTRFPY